MDHFLQGREHVQIFGEVEGDTGSACTLVKRGMRRLSDGGGWVRGLCGAWKNMEESETTHTHTRTTIDSNTVKNAEPVLYRESCYWHAELKRAATPLSPEIQS